ncbi:MAG: hypothetical protein FJZ47_03115 [Candidatus Tectomicrobia bacterium]|uniref:Uncharacterized protein n=1 Tax=Tectimicrobiota bacterium TaxID=2528274 RepID=A0A938B176_UNCTE|nr:hypothetical protein [Candidatus Tectomicrobia bacterium]
MRLRYNRTPDEPTDWQTRQVLAACPPDFAGPAEQCLALLQHITQEFTETASQRELDVLRQNLASLASAHRTLHLRSQRFGTPAQQAAMATMLRTQVASVHTTLQSLQAFSGNLTLLAARVDTDTRATQELHFLNQGLQAVLQEFHDAPQ